MNELCPFCIEFSNTELSIWNKKRDFLPLNRILFNHNGWNILPPLGSFMAGGLLIVSERHYRCCSVLDHETALSLDEIISRTVRVLENVYKTNILFFEHGTAACDSKGACCVDHAHINVFPVNFDIWEYLPAFKEKYKINSAVELSGYADCDYLWIFDLKSNFVFPVDGIPSQYIRTLITKNMNFPERWNWQDYLGLDEIQATMRDLDGKFHK